jgi:hypothetical protein
MQFANNLDEKLERHRFRQLAEAAFESAWATARAEADDYQHDPFSPDERRGFIDGYVDYLEAGGTGEPPALPPRKYWKAVYNTPQGRLAVQHWFQGYEFGAAMAKLSGHRQLVTIPVSDALASSTLPHFPSRQYDSKPAVEPVEQDQPVLNDEPLAETAKDVPFMARLPPISQTERSLF